MVGGIASVGGKGMVEGIEKAREQSEGLKEFEAVEWSEELNELEEKKLSEGLEELEGIRNGLRDGGRGEKGLVFFFMKRKEGGGVGVREG